MATETGHAPAALAEPGTYEVESHDEVYARVGDVELLARVFQPIDAPLGLPGIVDAHGGAWRFFDRKVDRIQCAGMASAGAVTVAVDFRQAPEGRWPDPAADVAAGVRWLKANAARFGVAPDQVLALGGSSGGQLAMWVALRGDHAECRTTRYVDEPDEGGPDAGVRGVLALWPVALPDDRYRYLLARRAAGDIESDDPLFNLDFLVEAHDGFFGDVATMAAANIATVLARGDHGPPPPLFLAQPEHDENVTRDMTITVADAWRAAGGRVELVDYLGVPHGFVNFGGDAADACVRDLVHATRSFLAEEAP